MDTTALYKCLAEPRRQRILQLLSEGPLCGCHFVEVLALDQVPVSKQLNYMKRMGMLEAEREANWMIYRLAEPVPALLLDNLAGLRRLPALASVFDDDERRLAAIMARVASGRHPCPGPVAARIACC